MPDMDELISPPDNPASMGPAALGLGRYLAPNITSLLRGEDAPPPAEMPSAPGKVPSTRDPREVGAIGEAVEGGLGALSLAAPGGAASAGGRAIMRETPNIASLLGAGIGLTASSEPAEAAQLTKKQQRELEFKKQEHAIDRERLQLEAQDASKRAEQANAQALELEKQKLTIAAENKRHEAEDASRIAVEKQKEEQELTRKHEAMLANRPFRERYPELSTAMSNSGLAMAALLPYGTRMWKAGKTSAFLKDWESVASKAETALSEGDLPQARILVDQLSGFKKQSAAMEKAGAKAGSPMALNAASAALPFETSVLPEAIDLASGSPEAKTRAKDTLMDPVRLPAALLQGATAVGIGAKAPLAGHNRAPPLARTEGADKTFKSLARERVAQAKKQGLKVTPVDFDPFGR